MGWSLATGSHKRRDPDSKRTVADFLDHCIAHYWGILLPVTVAGVFVGRQIDLFTRTQPLLAISYAYGQLEPLGPYLMGVAAVDVPVLGLLYLLIRWRDV